MLRSSRFATGLVVAGLITSLAATARPGRARSAFLVPGVQVTPDGWSTPARAPNTNGYTATFTVKNTLGSTATFALTRESSANITTTGQNYTSVTLASQAQINVDVSYNVGAPGAGYVTLWAEGSGAFDGGTWNVPVPAAQVTPDGATAAKRATNTGPYSEKFAVRNAGTTSTTFTLSCAGSSNVTCSGTSPTSMALPGGAQDSATATYSVGAAGTGTLTLTATNATGSEDGSFSVPVVFYGVAVTPDSGEELLRRPSSSGGATFTVKNTGSEADTFAFTCATSGNITCGYQMISPSSAILAGGAQTNVAVTYLTADAGTGRVYLGATGHHSADQGWFWVPVQEATVGVTPSNGWSKGAFTSTNNTAYFVVNNPDAAFHQYTLSCTASTDVTCGTVYPSSQNIAPNDFVNVSVGYSINASATGDRWIKLCVNSVDLCQGPYGKLNFKIWPNVAHGVSVTPASGTGPGRSSFTNGYTSSFTVRNVGTSSDTYTFTCQPATNVTCGTVSPSTLLLASLDTIVVTVTYNAGASGSSYVRLQASNANANNTGQINFTIAPSAGYGVAVTPDAKGVGVLPSTGASYPFTVRNSGTAQNTYTITATCTGGAIASGCTPSQGPVTIPAGGTSTVNVTYTSGGASTTGTIKLAAAQSSDPGVKDSGWVNVATGTAQAPSVIVSTVNPGVTLERDLCVTIGLVGGGAAECGDLRLGHGLPAVRTMGRVRAPTLVYSSGQAHPYPLVAAEVTLPASAANPDSVEVILKLNGVERRRARWAGSAFSPGRTNRIVIGYDALNDSTGAYSYTVDVSGIYPGSSLAASPAGSGEFILVNRSQSEFGAGWWLAGLERLRLDSMLWIGGDGSARVYRPAGTNVWAAAAVDRPDTLKKIGTEYVRLLPGKAEVWFDVQGRHVRTVSRLQHDTTRFHRDASGRVDTITVAPASQALRYAFLYNTGSGVLDSVVAPPLGTTRRVVKLTKSGSQVTAIQDPDASVVGFGYGGYANQIRWRTNRLNVAAYYFFDAAGKVIRDSIDPRFGQAVIVTRLRSHESAGFIGTLALDTADASAAVDGPRTDVGDSTLFWADRFGAPRRVRSALGYETSVRRENGTFPALVTRTQAPNGRVLLATYDARGHILTTTDSGTIVAGQPAVTRYRWNMTWDADTVIVPPEGDSTVIHIHPDSGHRQWQQDASGSASRANFTYNTSGLLATVQEPGATGVTIFNYDALGNLRSRVTPLGIRDSVARDAVGRDTLALSPLDTLQGQFRRTRTWYDLADRDTMVKTTAPQGSYTLTNVPSDTTTIIPDTQVVQNTYDAEGRLIELNPSTGPVELRTYDDAGRLLSRKLGSGPTSFVYDPAGNAVTQRYKTGDVTTTYDALNRLAQRVVPRRVFVRTDCQGHPFGPATGQLGDCVVQVPNFPNLPGDSLEIPADTSTFAYDVAGNQIRADNRYAQVRRSFLPNGLVETDTLRVRNYMDGLYGHVYTLRFAHDRNGRRAWMKVGATGDSLSYLYSASNGALGEVRDGGGHRYALTYTPAGRLDSLKIYPTLTAPTPGIKEARRYDADGRLTHRERRTGLDSVLHVDSLRYDPQGRVLLAITQSAAWSHRSNRTMAAYAGLGAVLASEVRELNSTNWEVEEFRVDRVGSVLYNRRQSRDDRSTPPERSSFDLHGLLTVRRGDPSPFCGYSPFRDTLYQAGDGGPTGGGNVIRSGEVHIACDQWPTVPGISSQLATNSFYTLDNRLAVIEQNNTVQSPPPTPPLSTDNWEEYWYDALGRRVLARSRRETVGAMFACEDWTVCISFVQRTVWDGDQVLVEERTSGLDAVTGGAPSYGTVRYVHLLGMDAPVAVLDNRFTNARVLHYNWRGLAEASSWTTGAPADDQLGGGGSTIIAWPAGQGVYYKRGGPDPTAGMTRTWIGSLPQNGQDATGMLYRRNRYFDPASGRFTQEDPIGLAGGLNLYGFAQGDPVNFSDPFGLGPCKNYPPGQCPEWLAAAERASEALNNVGLALAGAVSAISDFLTGGAAGHVWTAGSGIGPDGQAVGSGERLLLAGLAMAEMVPGETVIFSGRKVTNALARTLGIERRDLGGRIESIKKAAGLPGNLNVRITSLGNVLRKDTGEWIGNVLDELPHR